MVKNVPANAEDAKDQTQGLIPESGRSPGQPTPVFSLRKSHGQRTRCLQSTGLQRVGHDLATKEQTILHKRCMPWVWEAQCPQQSWLCYRRKS